ncbi:MAG: aminoacyl-histidine dipeptidase [Lentimicrobiaceae bacterium]|nr:aminoacyl-histidine dipeptidase [Lentimicrobiaceae bacterium]
MTNDILTLQPDSLWFFFNEICKIPRPSKKEEKIAEYLITFGEKRNLFTVKDATGNIIIRKPATPGLEKKKSVILQSHIDMVCEKNDGTVHDFDRDPIQPYIDGEWVKAKGTTLGADDGIGIAAQLALLAATDIEHGPIECVFTVDEETGLTGAFGLDARNLNSKILLNLDSEDEGELFIGCAGGIDTVAKLPIKLAQVPSDVDTYIIKVSGLLGGHSGDDINKGRGNANKILARLLFEGTKRGLRLSDFDGGNLRNAIAREAQALVTLPKDKSLLFLSFVKNFENSIKTEYRITEPGLAISCLPTVPPSGIFDEITQQTLIHTLLACPHGVITMSADIPDFVETSTNLASVKCKNNHIEITTSQRSSVESAKMYVASMVESVFVLAGAVFTHSDGYPGWTPNPDSEILEITRTAYESLFKVTPKVLAIHAGLECGLIGEKIQGMDMVSYGPTIKGAHSPDESLHIPSVQRFWNLTLEILKRIPE